jgi:hypothetical protein
VPDTVNSPAVFGINSESLPDVDIVELDLMTLFQAWAIQYSKCLVSRLYLRYKFWSAMVWRVELIETSTSMKYESRKKCARSLPIRIVGQFDQDGSKYN